MQIKKLEQELGAQIFERNNKRVLTSKIGIQIIMRAQMILQQASDLKQFAKNADDIYSGELRLGAFPTLAPYYLPKIVPKIAEGLASIDLLLIEEKTDILIDRLQNGALDCALIALPLEAENLDYQIVLKDEFYLAVSQNHKLASFPNVVQSDLEGRQLLLLEEGHCMRQNALDVCHINGAQEERGFRATSLETLRQMVRIGNGITLMPSLAKQKNDGLAYIKFKTNPPVRTIALAWRKTTNRQALFEKLATICHNIN